MPNDLSEAVEALVAAQLDFELWRAGAELDDQHPQIAAHHRKQIAAARLAIDVALLRTIDARLAAHQTARRP